MNIRTPLTLGTLVLAAACAPDAPPAVSVGPVAFTQDELLGLSADRREELGRLTAFGLAVADSSTDALGRPRLRRAEEDRLLEILAAERVLEEAGVGADVMEARYLTDPAYELTVRHILFFSERWRPPAHRAEAEAKARRALAALQGGADFAETAARLSEEPGAEGRQGLLQPGREGAWVDEFWAAASALDVGEISPVTETQYGYHILRLEDRVPVAFEEARPDVARALAPRVGDPVALTEAWRADDAARQDALDEAERRGLAVPASEVEALARAWNDTVTRWATALGFQQGATPEQVKAAAREALARTGQGAAIARDELRDASALVAARYDIQVTPVDA